MASLKDRIIQVLVSRQLIKKDQLDEALAQQAAHGGSAQKILVERGLVKEEDLLAAVSQGLGIPLINLGRLKLDPNLRGLISRDMAKQYEIAKIDEAREASLIQVLDRAVEPERKSKPKRTLITILTAIVAGFLAVIWAFIREAGQRARQNPEQASRLEALRRYVAQRGQPLTAGPGERLARVGELTEFYRERHPLPRPSDTELKRAFRGVRRLHERLKHLAA